MRAYDARDRRPSSWSLAAGMTGVTRLCRALLTVAFCNTPLRQTIRARLPRKGGWSSCAPDRERNRSLSTVVSREHQWKESNEPSEDSAVDWCPGRELLVRGPGGESRAA